MLIAFLTMSIIACNNADTGNKDTSIKTDSSAMQHEMVAREMYTCTMHNEVMSDKPGKCPKCEMNLVKQKMTEEQMKMMKEGTYIKPTE